MRQFISSSRKAFEEAGNLRAPLDVLVICSREQWPTPEWAAAALVDIVPRLQTREGRKWAGRHHRDMIDLERAEAVKYCRDHGVKWPVDGGGDDDDVFKAAARELRKSHYHPEVRGTARAIEKSYKLFKRRFAENPYRYHRNLDNLRVTWDLQPDRVPPYPPK